MKKNLIKIIRNRSSRINTGYTFLFFSLEVSIFRPSSSVLSSISSSLLLPGTRYINNATTTTTITKYHSYISIPTRSSVTNINSFEENSTRDCGGKRIASLYISRYLIDELEAAVASRVEGSGKRIKFV